MNTQTSRANAAQQETAQWIERLARFGYAAKGVVYCLVGILAFQAALNWGGRITGSEGAFRTIANQPFGNILLFLVAVGLVGYVIWRFVEAIFAPEDKGALQTIQQQPYGGILMAIVALGLAAYGIHLLVQARYRRISPPQ